MKVLISVDRSADSRLQSSRAAFKVSHFYTYNNSSHGKKTRSYLTNIPLRGGGNSQCFELCPSNITKTNSVALSPQANYTE
jgi:hypothetical protein